MHRSAAGAAVLLRLPALLGWRGVDLRDGAGHGADGIGDRRHRGRLAPAGAAAGQERHGMAWHHRPDAEGWRRGPADASRPHPVLGNAAWRNVGRLMAMRLVKLVVLVLAALAVSGEASAQVTLGDDAPLRFGRFEADGQIRYGVLSAGGVHEIDRSFLDPAAQVTGRVFPLEGLKLLAPVVPSKIIGIALNYPDNPPLPGNAGPGPGYFAKLPSAVIGDQG